ncbi:MAG TPA: plastocyanin/azurin family copper-binding protein [Gaiellaceae bacterium]|nr:plastocyanin/azurin family copper-binding protein [Gaiellaceae bacterium]
MSRIRISLLGLAAAVAVVAVGAGSSLAAGSAKKVVKPTTITVKASEFKYVLSSKTVAKPGKVVFKVTNVGKIPHNFVILSGINKATPLIKPRKSATLTVTFKKKGVYTYECTVGEHAEEGMLGTLKVK